MTMTHATSVDTASAPQILMIDGASIRDIASFYDEINRVFMVGEDWQLGASLDGLDDMLYGGYGVLRGKAPAIVVWDDMDSSRSALGVEATRAYYLAKLEHPQVFKPGPIHAALARLGQGGPTYFDLVLQVFADHPNITLRAADN
jgi:RNAse (barnase) inhibitor barstar